MKDITNQIFVYCTDFIINIANLLGVSYYEVNAVLFCVLYPLLILTFLIIYIIKRIQLKKAIRAIM